MCAGVILLLATALPAQADQHKIYDGIINRNAQPSWIESNGGSLMKETYHVRLFVNVVVPTQAQVSYNEHKVSNPDAPNGGFVYWTTDVQANIGYLAMSVFKVEGKTETYLGEADSPLILNYSKDGQNSLPDASIAKFTEATYLSFNIPGTNNTLGMSGFFGPDYNNSVLTSLSVDATGTVEIYSIDIPAQMTPRFEITQGINVLYFGSVAFK
jgi:hypothetical protein